MVVIDVSGSMSASFDAEGIQRIGAVKVFFEAYSDKVIAYKYNHEVAVIFFESHAQLSSGFTKDFEKFKKVVDAAQPSGGTSLYDALSLAVDSLIEQKKKYPQALVRILALTDGEDNTSKISALDAAKKIIKNNVILDSFVVGT